MEHFYRKQPSQRQLQVGSEIHRAIIEEFATNDLLNEKFFTISFIGVKMTDGLKQARIIFTTTHVDVKGIKSALQKNAGYLRRVIASKLKLRFAPEIIFEYDSSADDLEKLNEILQQTMHD